MIAVWREIEINEDGYKLVRHYRVYLIDCGCGIFLDLTQRELDELREMHIVLE